MGERAAAVVVPETTAGDENVDCAVVVVVAHGDGPLAMDRVGGAREAARSPPVVMEQAVGSGRARHQDVRAPIVVQIGERGVGAALHDPVGVREHRERAVEVVSIDAERPSAHQEEIEIAVVIEVDEQWLPRAGHFAHARGGGHILEPLAFAIVQQVAVTVSADCKHVEPAVVVVVGERRGDGAHPGWQWQRHLGADVRHETAVHRIEPHAPACGNQQVVLAVAVVIAERQRRQWTAELRQAALAGDIGEADLTGRGSRRDAPHRDERLRAERQHRPSRERPFDPVHLRQ